jgi:hypothetical protein
LLPYLVKFVIWEVINFLFVDKITFVWDILVSIRPLVFIVYRLIFFLIILIFLVIHFFLIFIIWVYIKIEVNNVTRCVVSMLIYFDVLLGVNSIHIERNEIWIINLGLWKFSLLKNFWNIYDITILIWNHQWIWLHEKVWLNLCWINKPWDESNFSIFILES